MHRRGNPIHGFARSGRQAVTFSWSPGTHWWVCALACRESEGSNMAFRKTPNGVKHDQPAETEVETDIREFVRRDVVTNRERQPENDSEMVVCKTNAVLQRWSVTGVQTCALPI